MQRHLPLIGRADEEATMHAVMPGEQACLHGKRCQGALLPNGYTLPRFPDFSHCIICLRAETTRRWLEGLGETQTEILQPYRNAIGPGEYAVEACIQPVLPTFEGVSDPIARFVPWRLRWEGFVLKQTDMAFYLRPSLHHEARPPNQLLLPNGHVDVFLHVLKAGLLFPFKTPLGISYSLHRAIWFKDPKLPLDSTWVQAAHQWCFGGDVTAQSASWAVKAQVVALTLLFPLFRDILCTRHPDWPGFEQNVMSAVDLIRASPDEETYRKCKTGFRRERFIMPLKLAFVSKTTMVGIPRHWPKLSRADRDVQYVCTKCDAFKGALMDSGLKKQRLAEAKRLKNKGAKRQQPVDVDRYAFGQRHVSYNYETGAYSCFKQRAGGRLARPVEPCGELSPVDVLGNFLILKGRCYAQCTKCGVLAHRAAIQNQFECGFCTAPPCNVCDYCRDKRGLLTPYVVFENCGIFGAQTIYLCEKHLVTPQIWSRRLLFERLQIMDDAVRNKRHVAPVKRG